MTTPFRRVDAKIEGAVQLAKVGQFEGARTLLSLPTTVHDDELLNGLLALSEGLSLFNQDRHGEAGRHFSAAAAVLQATSDREVQFVIEVFRNLSEGISRLASGDAHGAVTLLDVGAEQTKRLAFFYPELENAAIKAKALSYIAMARTFVILGDMVQARQWFARADQEHDQLLRLLEKDENADPFHFASVYGMRLELIVVMFRVELEALDLDAAGRFLKDAAHDQSNLERHLPRLADSLQSRLMKAVVALLEAAKRLHPVAQAVLMERRSLSREDVRRLKEVDDLLFDAKELALEGGQGGASYLYTISQLQRFRLSLLKAGSVNASDFGRMAGPISAATLVALMVTIHLTFAPTGLSAIGFFFGAVVVSLIAGFGYGALRFRPLLELVRQEIQRAEDE